MLCKPCYYRNKRRRDGGDFGLCWQHKKTKCGICQQISAGKLYCDKCEHQCDKQRWKNESVNLHIEEDSEFLQVQLRKEKLWESKRHAHRALEIYFRSMALTLEAIWGGIKDPKAKEAIQIDGESKKAA